jgi:polyhydroxybutyrate depolymerase
MTLHKIWVGLSALLLIGAGCTPQDTEEDMAKLQEPGNHRLKLTVGDLERKAFIHVLKGYDGKKPVPVVLMIHGAGGTGEWTNNETSWGDKADKEGFLVVLPEGVPVNAAKPAKFLTNPQLWNDGSGRGVIGRQNNDDVGFIKALLDELEKRYRVDSKRVYATGFSNGAGMTFRLGAELAPRLAAIAPVASHCWLKDPKPERAIPTLYMVGTQDPLIPLVGGEVKSPWTGRAEQKPAVSETLDKWAKALGCPAEPKVVQDQDGVKIVNYGPGKDQAELLAYTIDGLGHHWPSGKGGLGRRIGGEPSSKVRATDVIWDFFVRHPLP